MIPLLDSPRAKNEYTPGTPQIAPNTAVIITVTLIDIVLSGHTAGKEAKEKHKKLLGVPCELRDHCFE